MLYLWDIICSSSCTFPSITQENGLYVRTVSKNQVCLVTGLYSDHATTNLYEIPLFTRISLLPAEWLCT